MAWRRFFLTEVRHLLEQKTACFCFVVAAKHLRAQRFTALFRMVLQVRNTLNVSAMATIQFRRIAMAAVSMNLVRVDWAQLIIATAAAIPNMEVMR